MIFFYDTKIVNMLNINSIESKQMSINKKKSTHCYKKIVCNTFIKNKLIEICLFLNNNP